MEPVVKSVPDDFFQCEWLLGDRKPSPEDLDKGIDTNSPLFQAILENPVVQLGLTNPKTLLGKSRLGSCNKDTVVASK